MLNCDTTLCLFNAIYVAFKNKHIATFSCNLPICQFHGFRLWSWKRLGRDPAIWYPNSGRSSNRMIRNPGLIFTRVQQEKSCEKRYCGSHSEDLVIGQPLPKMMTHGSTFKKLNTSWSLRPSVRRQVLEHSYESQIKRFVAWIAADDTCCKRHLVFSVHYYIRTESTTKPPVTINWPQNG